MVLIICVNCGDQMKVKKMGVTVRFEYYAGYFRGDLYYCPKCGYEVISGLGAEIFDPYYKVDYDFGKSEYIEV